MKLTILDFLVIAVYLGGVSAIGFYCAKQQTSREEYFLGGRRVHWLLAGGSIMATLLSTATYLFIPGEMIRYGISYFAGLIALPFVIPVVTRLILPVLLALPITSAYEYLEKRFSRNVRKLAGFVFVLRTCMWMGIIIYTASLAISEVTGWNIYATIILAGLITTLYTTVGGFQTVIWTDNLQLLVLFGGAIAIPVVIGFASGTGPVTWWNTFSQAGRTSVDAFSFDLTVRTTLVAVILGQFFWNVCTNAGDQVVVQRYLSTPSMRDARRSVWIFATMQIVLITCLAVSGLALFTSKWQSSGLPVQDFQNRIAPEADRLLPRFIAEGLPAGISGLLLAALLAAAMSSLSSAINSISTVICSDMIAQRQDKSKRNSELQLEKALALGAGIVGVLWGCIVGYIATHTTWNLLELCLRMGHLFVGPIAVLFFAGFLLRHAATSSVLVGFIASTFVSLLISFGKELFQFERSVSFVWIVPLPFLVGIAMTGLCGLWLSGPTKEQVESFTLAGLNASRSRERLARDARQQTQSVTS